MRGFGELEAVVMQRIWDRDHPVTVRELFEELRRERVIAYTTVLSTLDNLHTKGWVARDKVGNAHQYRPTASREEYSARVMREALASGGDTATVLNHLVHEMTGEESEALLAVARKLARRRRQ